MSGVYAKHAGCVELTCHSVTVGRGTAARKRWLQWRRVASGGAGEAAAAPHESCHLEGVPIQGIGGCFGIGLASGGRRVVVVAAASHRNRPPRRTIRSGHKWQASALSPRLLLKSMIRCGSKLSERYGDLSPASSNIPLVPHLGCLASL